MITAWRIVKARLAANAFDGEGARVFGGRWNSPGVRMVYVASTRSLAVLEMAVHLDRATVLESFVLIPCQFDERLVTNIGRAALPAHWRSDPPPAGLAAVGDTWIRERRSPALAVPSAIIDQELNYFLNPLHPRFSQVRIGVPQAFEFDRRLIK